MSRVRWLMAFSLITAFAHAELPVLVDVARDPTWRELMAHLSATTARQASFEERRYFSFRKEPILLTGEMRMEPGRGLSLSYLTPEKQTLIADERGLLLRDDEGRERIAPADRKATGVSTALVSVLRFDLPALERDFILRGQREGNKWTLTFDARTPDLAAAIGGVTLSGEGNRLLKIEMGRSAAQRIEIRIVHAEEPVIFSEAVLKRFFR